MPRVLDQVFEVRSRMIGSLAAVRPRQLAPVFEARARTANQIRSMVGLRALPTAPAAPPSPPSPIWRESRVFSPQIDRLMIPAVRLEAPQYGRLIKVD